MRPALLKLLIAVPFVFIFSARLSAQNGFYTGLNGLTVDLPCGQTCITRSFQIPHLKTTSDYTVVPIDYVPFPYVTAAPPQILPCASQDDKYFEVTTLPFNFCFYDSVFDQLVVSTNGSISFDLSNATKGANWALNTGVQLPFEGTGTQGTAGLCPDPNGVRLPKAGIFGVFCDIFPQAADPNYKIEARVEGTAPWRRFVVSFSQVPLFGCTASRVTSQIVIHESTALIDIFIESKPGCTSNGGLAIVGIQNYVLGTPDAKGRTAPGRGANNGPWTASNEGWRFTPSGAVTRFKRCELQTLAGATLITGDTITTTAGLLDVTFPAFCQTLPNNKYVIKTTYTACDNVNSEISVLDTITVNRTTALNATLASTPTSCGLTGTGTATVTVPTGVGTAPYTYVLTPGSISQQTNQFTGLTAGNYSITVTDNGGGCSSTLPFTIGVSGNLAVTYAVTNTSCVGAANGAILVNPPNGTPPITYSINGGPFSANNNFTNLAPGTYFISTHDAAGCVRDFDPVTVAQGVALTITTSVTPTTCPGANNGSITITGVVGGGTPPYQYSINGGPYTTNPTFTGLVNSVNPYFVSVRDALGCTINNVPVIVTAGNNSVTGTATPSPTSCAGVNDGSIAVTGNGAGPFTYSLNGGPFQTSNVFTGLAPGTYNIVIREGGQCNSAPIPATVTAGGGIQATVTPTSTACASATNGSILVTPTNGSGPYTFVLNSTVTLTGATANFTGLAAGNHSIMITDAGGCITAAPLTTTITTGTGFTATYTSVNSTCTGATNGSITVTPSGGAAPFTFVLGTTTQTGATTTFNNLASGTYSIQITDANGCQFVLNNATVTASAGFTATYTSVNSSCTGATNGSITVTPNGGSGPYTFVLGTTTQTGATNTAFNNLASGNYSVQITDANGCQFTLNATVTASAGFTATYTSVNSSCTGATNGSLTVTANGGAGPYTFVLGTTTQTGATNTTFNNLASGNYSIQITDAVGCQFTLNASVTAGPGFTATYTSVNSSCAVATNGSITVTPGTGGTGPYTFVLGTTTQTGATNTTFANLASGTYSIQITDANGCQFTLNNATITANAGLTATHTSTNTSCSGAADGTITVTPGTGGTAPYTFVLNTTTLTGTTATFTNLAVGNYNITVTDANNCQVTISNAAVAAGPPLNVTINTFNTTCPGVNDGSMNATPTNGTAPYTFVLDGTNTITGNAAAFGALAAGVHTLQVTDASGCSITLPNFTIGSGSGITATVTPGSTSCIGASNGNILITPTNGSGPYTFVLNGTITQTGAANTTFTNLAAGGGNSIVITDAIGCTGTFNNINVPQGASLQVNTTPAATTCNTAANGQIFVEPTNGAGPYTFVLNSTITQTGATNTTFTGLVANTYNLVITDAAGCVTGPIPATVNPGPAITVTPGKLDATCFGLPTGSINAVVSTNATAPVEYSINNVNWQTAPGFTGLLASTYTVYVRDAAGCTNSAQITVGQPTQLTSTPTAQNVSCNSLSDGRITINAAGGTPTYSYSLDNTNFQPSNLFAVPAGSYTVYVRDVNNCTAPPATIVVTQPTALSATAVPANASCDGGNDGTITVTPTGGTSPYQYAISGGTFQSSPVLTTAPGTYDVEIRDANSCTFQITGVVVGLTDNLTLTPAVDPAPICEGGSAQLQVTTNATQFTWTPAADLSNASIVNPVASPKTPTTYTVTVTLGRCSLTDQVFVDVMPAPVANPGIPGNICYGQSYTLQAVGDPSFTYNWSPATFLSSTTGQSVTSVLPDKTMTYKLTVIDNNGCQSLAPAEIKVNVTPPLQVKTSPAVDTVVHPGVQVPLLASVQAPDATYTWSPATGLDNPAVANPIASVPFNEGAVVTYHVTATTTAGCKGEADITIRVYRGPDIYVPNAFTPNGDGRNDKFIPFPVGIKQLTYFRVFNRWGQMVYSTTTLNEGWNGRVGGFEQSTGVYTWMVEGITMGGQKITKRGVVTLIR